MKQERSFAMVILIFIIFSVISLLTNILNPLIPNVRDSFKLSHTLAGFLPFAFFIAYGVMSIPSGMLLKKLDKKTMLILPFILAFAAALFFILIHNFPSYLLSLFLIGAGMAMLQVVINPLLRVAGGEEHFAAYSVTAQLFFGGAAYLGPILYSYLVLNLGTNYTGGNLLLDILYKLTPKNLPWVSLYWIFAFIALAMAAVLYIIKIPKIKLKEDEQAGPWETYKNLFKNKIVILYFIGIFAYVGSEQGIGNWISEFLRTYHHLNPETVGAHTVSLYWGLLTLGCVLGIILLKLFDSRKILISFASLAILFLTISLFGSAKIVVYTFPMIGFFYSVMWSIIFSLALNSLPENHGSSSGILCTGIIGGAIVPLIIGALADLIGLRFGMMFLYLTLGYILSIGFWARPLINNETISLRRKKAGA